MHYVSAQGVNERAINEYTLFLLLNPLFRKTIISS